MITLNKWWQQLILGGVVLGLSMLAFAGIAAFFIYPTLPSLDVISDYKPKLPLRIYSEEGLLIGEFGQERRAYIKIEQVPKKLKDAVLAIEDRRFYQHHGIDFKGILRAIKNNVTGKSREGASTITMQVAKNFFSSPNGRRTIGIKINEMLLAIKIENNLTKNKILELYLNQIYLGQRSYGFAAASQTYFGKPLNEINLAEAALLAGLPKAPSGYNPYSRPDRAMRRQREVLRDMHRFGFIDEPTYQAASETELHFRKTKVRKAFEASYVSEIVRDALYQKYKDEIYVSGLHVYTTIRKDNQEAANAAIRDGLVNYDARHGFRGAEKKVDLTDLSTEDKEAKIEETLKKMGTYNGLMPAVVVGVKQKSLHVVTKDKALIELSGKGIKLVKKYLKPTRKSLKKKAIVAGDVIRVLKRGKTWTVVQLPQVQASLVSLDPQNGAVRALVGGFDFRRSKFNHATQAKRQPGSSFKPFVYSAALEKGFTPATIIEDEPIEYEAGEVGEEAWAPQNYSHKYNGPMRLREGLAKSVNTVAIRMLESIGGRYAQDYITRFGFRKKDHPPYLTMALGAGSTTNWELAGAYAVFANGGYRVPPYIIDKIVDQNGNEIFSSKPPEAGGLAQRVIDERNAFLMHSMLQTVVAQGTARKALRLGRKDIAGKTGTTNDHYDAWFAGYSPKQVAVVWLGYDQPRSLGARETGGGATLPIWIQYMKTALKGLPQENPLVPEGIMQVNIDMLTGTRDDEYGEPEYFYFETPPPEYVDREIFGEEPATDLLELLSRKAQEVFGRPIEIEGSQPKSQTPNPLQPNSGALENPQNTHGIPIQVAPNPDMKQQEKQSQSPRSRSRRSTPRQLDQLPLQPGRLVEQQPLPVRPTLPTQTQNPADGQSNGEAGF